MLGKEILLATTYLDNKAARQIQRQKAKNERMIKGRKKKIYERLGEVYEIWEPHLLGEGI